MRRMTIAGVLALGLSSGLQANEPYAVTPDGTTEMVFAMPTAEASIDIANTCRQRGLAVEAHTRTSVTCARKSWHDVADELGLETADKADSEIRLRFFLRQEGKVSIARASGTRTVIVFDIDPVTGAGFHDAMMDFMLAAGGAYPVGTRFPNHASMGFAGRIATVDDVSGFQVVELTPGSMAERAGLMKDDLVTRIAGKPIVDFGDVRDALEGVAGGKDYEILVKRGGEERRVRMQTEFRAAISE